MWIVKENDNTVKFETKIINENEYIWSLTDNLKSTGFIIPYRISDV